LQIGDDIVFESYQEIPFIHEYLYTIESFWSILDAFLLGIYI